jgi:PKD repeat protein
MRQFAVRAAIGIGLACSLALGACSTSLDNGLDGIPQVQITESARVALTAGAIGSTGLTLTDEASGAAVDIPAGAVISLDASDTDNIAAVVPDSLVVVLRPISQFLANQNGDLLTIDGLNLPNLTKVGALAILPVIGRSSVDMSVTIPVASTATGELTVWRFTPDDVLNGDGELTAHPSVGHWQFVDTATASSGRVTVSTSAFGQYLVTTAAAAGGGGGTAPTVSLEATPTTGDAPLAVTFTATADDDGTVTNYEWDFDGDGTVDTETTTGTATHTYDTDGQFEAEVTVTDNEGETGSDTVLIGVGNAPPVITALLPLTATTNEAVTLTVTASDPDTDGSITNYKWDLNNDDTFEVDTLAVASTTHTFTTSGTQTIGVQVTDNEGAVTEQTFDIVVADGTTGPTASLTADPASGVLDETSELEVAFTTELTPDTIVATSVLYDFGDGTTPVTETETPLATTHTYATAGNFTVTATITPEGGGADIVATTNVTVLPAGTVVAELTATPDGGELVAGELAVDFVTTLTPNTATVESAIYDFGDSTTPETITDTPLAASHTYTAAGVYEVTVTLTPTGGGDPIFDTTTVTVTAAGGENQDPVAELTATAIEGNSRGFNLDASASTDPDGDTLTFSWDWNGDSVEDAAQESTTVIYPESADGVPQTIVLTVTDSEGNVATAQRVVTPTAPAS